MYQRGYEARIESPLSVHGCLRSVEEFASLSVHMRNEQNRPNESLTKENLSTESNLKAIYTSLCSQRRPETQLSGSPFLQVSLYQLHSCLVFRPMPEQVRLQSGMRNH